MCRSGLAQPDQSASRCYFGTPTLAAASPGSEIPAIDGTVRDVDSEVDVEVAWAQLLQERCEVLRQGGHQPLPAARIAEQFVCRSAWIETLASHRLHLGLELDRYPQFA
jgi:hypothetical protein